MENVKEYGQEVRGDFASKLKNNKITTDNKNLIAINRFTKWRTVMIRQKKKHKNLKWLNAFVGQISLIPLAQSHHILKATHMKHHAHPNNPEN